MPYYYPTIVNYKGLRNECYLFEVDGPEKTTFLVESVVKGYARFIPPKNCSFATFIGIVDGCLTKGSNFPMELQKAFPGVALKGAVYTFNGQKVKLTRL